MFAMLSPFCGCGMTSCCTSCLASCALQAFTSACCSIAGCFCPRNAKTSKLAYLLIFLCSAVLGVVLRYHGEAALSGWVSIMQNVCSNGACWGMQADYRISASVLAFFLFMMILTAMVPIAHNGAWLLKVMLYVLFLGISLLIPNSFFDTYAQISRYGSGIFLVMQCVMLVDLVYTVHEWFLAKMEARDKEMEASGWQPGLLSNGWKVLYLSSSAAFFFASVTAIGLLFKFFGDCSLMQFFLAETLLMGIGFIVVSLLGAVGKGLLPPCLVFAYNTYLCYGAITNNPDGACNRFAATENQNRASIITGLVIVTLSITYAAYSSAGSMHSAVAAVSSRPRAGEVVDVVALPPARPVDIELGASGSGAAKTSDAAPDAYATPETTASGRSSSPLAKPAPGTPVAADNEAVVVDAVEPYAWVFHMTMLFAGLYLAMLLTNWGDSSTAAETGNPELSIASMWVRIVSQWVIYGLYAWSLMAPFCCPNRDFS